MSYQSAQNTFTSGVNTDIDPLMIKNTFMTSALNVRLMNVDGKGFVIVNAGGNDLRFSITANYKPIGWATLDGILYIISTDGAGSGEIGTYPSPNYAGGGGTWSASYAPLKNFFNQPNLPGSPTLGTATDLRTTLFNFYIDPSYDDFGQVRVQLKPHHDGSMNIYIADNRNPVRVINSNFDSDANIKTNWYAQNDFYGSINLVNESPTIAEITHTVEDGGFAKAGTYKFYVAFSDKNFNATSFHAYSKSIPIINQIGTVQARGAAANTILDKKIVLTISNIENNYKYVVLGFSYHTEAGTTCGIIDKYHEITGSSITIDVPFNQGSYYDVEAAIFNTLRPSCLVAKDIDQNQNRLFLSNTKNEVIHHADLLTFAQKVLLGHDSTKTVNDAAWGTETTSPTPLAYNGYRDDDKGQYKDGTLFSDYTGYQSGDLYCAGIVFYTFDGRLSQVYPVRGRDCFSDVASTNYNTNGIYRFPSPNEHSVCPTGGAFGAVNTVKILGLKFDWNSALGSAITVYNGSSYMQSHIKGFFFVRAERKPTVVAQGILLPMYGYTSFQLDDVGPTPRSPYFANTNTYDPNNDNFGIGKTRLFPNLHYLAIPMQLKGVNGSNTDEVAVSLGLEALANGAGLSLAGLDNASPNTLPDVHEDKFGFFSHDLKYRDDIPFDTHNYSIEPFYYRGTDHGDVVVGSDFPDTINCDTFDDDTEYTAMAIGQSDTGLRHHLTPGKMFSTSLIAGVARQQLFYAAEHRWRGSVADTDPLVLRARMHYILPETATENNSFVSKMNEGSPTDDKCLFYHKSQNGGTDYVEGYNLEFNIPGYIAVNFNTDDLDASPGTLYKNQADYPATARKLDFALAQIYNIKDPVNYDIATHYNFKNEMFYQISDTFDFSTLTGLGAPTSHVCYMGDTFTQRGYMKTMYNTKYSAKDVALAPMSASVSVYYRKFGLMCSWLAQHSNNIAMQHDDGIKSVYPNKRFDSKLDYCYEEVTSESTLLNTGYNNQLGIRFYTGFDSSLPDYVNRHITRIWNTNPHLPQSYKDGYREITATAYKDYELKLGEIVSIQSFRNYILVIHENGITLNTVNERFMNSQDGVSDITIGIGPVLTDIPFLLTDKFGSQHQWSIINTPNGIYGIDFKRRIAWHYDGKINIISQTMGFSKRLYDIIDSYNNSFGQSNVTQTLHDVPVFGALNDKQGIAGFYDPKLNTIGWTFFLNKAVSNLDPRTIVIDIRNNIYLDEVSFTSPFYCSLNEDFFSINPSNQIQFYLHDLYTNSLGANNACTYYGTLKQHNVKISVNENAHLEKVFHSLDINSDYYDWYNVLYATDLQTSQHGIPFRKVGTSFYLDPKYRENKWMLSIPRATAVTGTQTNFAVNSRMRGKHLQITLIGENAVKMYLRDIITKYIHSVS